MEELYRSPQSDLITDYVERPKKRWKILFFLILVLELLSIASLVTDDEVKGYEVFIELVIYTFVIIGLFGFAFHKKILWPIAWKLVLPVTLIYDVYTLATTNWQWGEYESMSELYVMIGITLAIMLPLMGVQYYALFKYGFSSGHIWRNHITKVST